MHYIPNASNVEEMLGFLGIKSVDELYSDVPADVMIDGLAIPPGRSELDVAREVKSLAAMNRPGLNFMGGGIYNHFIPPAVRAIVGRSEFYTAYTPYQPEISQGMLQTLFEYQSHIAELTGMDAANSSMYDGATALAEAALMAMRATKRKKILVPQVMADEKRSVLKNYLAGAGMVVKPYPFNEETGTHRLDTVADMVDDDTAAVYVEVPNHLGLLEDPTGLKEAIGEKVLLIVGVNPMTLGILEAPGNYGADIVVGEGQPLGIPLSFGGPLLGVFATRDKYIRHMPGRIIGMTRDSEGKRAFVMTLQTREQHIKRAKATSNICSNEALMAVTTAVYLSLMGPGGLRKVGEISMARAHYMHEKMLSTGLFESPYTAEFFNEFPLKYKGDLRSLIDNLATRDVHPGIIPSGLDRDDILLTAVTEMNSIDDINRAVDEIVYTHREVSP